MKRLIVLLVVLFPIVCPASSILITTPTITNSGIESEDSFLIVSEVVFGMPTFPVVIGDKWTGFAFFSALAHINQFGNKVHKINIDDGESFVYQLQLNTEVKTNYVNGDMNCDGRIDLIDVLVTLKTVSGINYTSCR